MQILKLKTDIALQMKGLNPSSSQAYQPCNSQNQLANELKKYGEWVTYSFKKKIGIKGQRSYEDFCCGFLRYYDIEVRNGSVDHNIYFEWGGPTQTNQFFVRIYITPKPYSQVIKPVSKTTSSSGWVPVALGAPPPAAGTSDPPKPPPPPPPAT
jgi:hypothetical protein